MLSILQPSTTVLTYIVHRSSIIYICIGSLEQDEPFIYKVAAERICNLHQGRYGSGGKSCRLPVRGLPFRSHPGRVEVSLSKSPNPQLLLMSWLVPCMAANRRWCVNVCEWVNERHKLYRALDKGAI